MQRRQLDLLQQLNRDAPADGPRTTRSSKGVIAVVRAGLPHAAAMPEVAGPRAASRRRRWQLYGIDDPATDDFGRQCLLARRLAEAGVRFVQVSTGYQWDQHENLVSGHEKNARAVDRPIAGLLDRPEGPRAARRHAGHLGRRVRPHAVHARATTAATTTPTASRCGWPAAA